MGMTLEEKIEDILREDLVLSTDGGQPYIKFDDVAIDKIFDLIKEEKKNGFYMACGVCGIERDRVDELYEKCIAQLQAELEGLK